MRNFFDTPAMLHMRPRLDVDPLPVRPTPLPHAEGRPASSDSSRDDKTAGFFRHRWQLVVPFAAGGPSDVAGRIVAQGLSEKLGQQVIVENPAGAGGTLGSLRVAKAPPDGYQFVIGNSGCSVAG